MFKNEQAFPDLSFLFCLIARVMRWMTDMMFMSENAKMQILSPFVRIGGLWLSKCDTSCLWNRQHYLRQFVLFAMRSADESRYLPNRVIFMYITNITCFLRTFVFLQRNVLWTNCMWWGRDPVMRQFWYSGSGKPWTACFSGKTHNNECQFKNFQCVMKKSMGLDLEKSHDGQCAAKVCYFNCTHTPFDPVCDINGSIYRNLCVWVFKIRIRIPDQILINMFRFKVPNAKMRITIREWPNSTSKR